VTVGFRVENCMSDPVLYDPVLYRSLAAQGFGSNLNPRQKYGLTERDDATGLDHTWFRKNENRAGRWTSPDPYKGSCVVGDPQSWNRYSYVGNEPTNFIDPSGLINVWVDGRLYNCEGGCVGTANGWDCEWNCYCVGFCGGGGGGGGPGGNPGGGPGGGGSGGGGPGGGNPSNQGTTSANDDKKKEKAYKDCMKAETRNCENLGRAYFNDNFYTALVAGPLATTTVRTGYGFFKEGLGLWAAFKAGAGALVTKAGAYVTAVASVLAVAALTRAAVAVENTCKMKLDELCKRRAGIL